LSAYPVTTINHALYVTIGNTREDCFNPLAGD
jgi:hypothetical protein